MSRTFLKPVVLFLWVVCTTLCLTSLAAPQVREAWVARYGGGTAYALATDHQGNVYVTGGSGGDYATIKYDTNGNQVWIARYNGPGNSYDGATALVVDGQGNIYVTGTSDPDNNYYNYNFDYATVKYDANGNQLWVARYSGLGDGEDRARALAVDGEGNVYVTGRSYGSLGTGNDYATVKYDANGNQVWIARYNGPGNGDDRPYALAVDSEGNVYVTGYSEVSRTDRDYVTVKYDTNGNPVWLTRYRGPGDWDWAYALALDSQGNVYVTGNSWGGLSTQNDYVTVKYDANGNQVWIARYNGPGNGDDFPNALAVDSQGNVYVTGLSDPDDDYDTGNYDYATVKYDANGNQLWAARYSGPGDRWDEATALALDSQGNVYVTGTENQLWVDANYVTVKYDANGNQSWLARYNGPGNRNDRAYALAVDGAGNVYVTGNSDPDSDPNNNNNDYATVKYEQGLDGDVNWDGCVDDRDLARVLPLLNQPCSGCLEDLNGDGAVDAQDLLIGLLNFGQGC